MGGETTPETPQEPTGPRPELDLPGFWPLADICRLTTELMELRARLDRLEPPPQRLLEIEARVDRLEVELGEARQQLARARELGFVA